MHNGQPQTNHKTADRGLCRLLCMGLCYVFVPLLLSFSLYGNAAAAQLLIVANTQQALHDRFATQIKQHLASQHNDEISIRIIDTADWQAETSNQHQLTLVLGTRAALAISRHKLTSAILFSMVPAITYHQTIATSTACETGRCSAVFIDQPVTRTLALAHLALPQLKTAGLLSSHTSRADIAQLKANAQKQGMHIRQQQADDPENMIFKLTDILQHSDALLALPDHGIYSRHTVQNILLTAYRYHKPVIGYSQAFVKAGALFAVYSSPDQLSQHTASVVAQFFANQAQQLPPPQHPRYFSVAVNRMVAKSLGIDIQTEIELQKRLEALSNE